VAWVYILKLTNGQYYIGSTDNVTRRLTRHMQGHTATTKRVVPTALVLKQEYKTLRDARSVELKIKKLKRRDYIEKMVKAGYINLKP